jgi:hypothetical protein
MGTFRALCVLPLTAILHHAVFYRPTCVWNPFLGRTLLWLARDPSLPWAILLVVALRVAIGEAVARRFFLATLPLTVWLWDVPFSGRWVHRTMHDGHAVIGGAVVHTHHVYALCALLFAASSAPAMVRRMRNVKKAAPEGAAGLEES